MHHVAQTCSSTAQCSFCGDTRHHSALCLKEFGGGTVKKGQALLSNDAARRTPVPQVRETSQPVQQPTAAQSGAVQASALQQFVPQPQSYIHTLPRTSKAVEGVHRCTLHKYGIFIMMRLHSTLR